MKPGVPLSVDRREILGRRVVAHLSKEVPLLPCHIAIVDILPEGILKRNLVALLVKRVQLVDVRVRADLKVRPFHVLDP